MISEPIIQSLVSLEPEACFNNKLRDDRWKTFVLEQAQCLYDEVIAAGLGKALDTQGEICEVKNAISQDGIDRKQVYFTYHLLEESIKLIQLLIPSSEELLRLVSSRLVILFLSRANPGDDQGEYRYTETAAKYSSGEKVFYGVGAKRSYYLDVQDRGVNHNWEKEITFDDESYADSLMAMVEEVFHLYCIELLKLSAVQINKTTGYPIYHKKSRLAFSTILLEGLAALLRMSLVSYLYEQVPNEAITKHSLRNLKLVYARLNMEREDHPDEWHKSRYASYLLGIKLVGELSAKGWNIKDTPQLLANIAELKYDLHNVFYSQAPKSVFQKLHRNLLNNISRES